MRSRRYAATVDPLIAAGNVMMHSIVLLELYAGTQNAADKRAIDTIADSARRLEQLVHPTEEDFCLSGKILAYQSRLVGRLRPQNHSHDLLLAIGAARSGSALLTNNQSDMDRWADALSRRAQLRVLVLRPGI